MAVGRLFVLLDQSGMAVTWDVLHVLVQLKPLSNLCVQDQGQVIEPSWDFFWPRRDSGSACFSPYWHFCPLLETSCLLTCVDGGGTLISSSSHVEDLPG